MSTYGHQERTNSPADSRFPVFGFSARRVAFALCAVSACLVPIHYCDSPCEVSELTGGLGFLIMLLVLALCAASPRGTWHRFRPAGLAFLVWVVHALSTH